MFLHCLNHWKLETPTARKQQMSSEDVSAYKVGKIHLCQSTELKEFAKMNFWYPSKRPKWVNFAVFGHFWGTENGTAGAWIKILRPLFNRNNPLKHSFRNFGDLYGPQEVIFGHLIDFGHFPIEIPIEAERNYHHGKEQK